jgi:hypothetical protein
MRGAVGGVTPLRSIRMRERAFNFSAKLQWFGRGTIVLTIVNTVTQPAVNWNSKLRIIRSVKFHAADDTQFRVSIFYGLRDSIDNSTIRYMRSARL